jgi:hypothetical protein
MSCEESNSVVANNLRCCEIRYAVAGKTRVVRIVSVWTMKMRGCRKQLLHCIASSDILTAQTGSYQVSFKICQLANM